MEAEFTDFLIYPDLKIPGMHNSYHFVFPSRLSLRTDQRYFALNNLRSFRWGLFFICRNESLLSNLVLSIGVLALILMSTQPAGLWHSSNREPNATSLRQGQTLLNICITSRLLQDLRQVADAALTLLNLLLCCTKFPLHGKKLNNTPLYPMSWSTKGK